MTVEELLENENCDFKDESGLYYRGDTVLAMLYKAQSEQPTKECELAKEVLKVWNEDGENGEIQMKTPIAWYRVLRIAGQLQAPTHEAKEAPKEERCADKTLDNHKIIFVPKERPNTTSTLEEFEGI